MTIPGFSTYDITPEGVVTSIKTGRVIPIYAVTASQYYRYKRVYIVDDTGHKRTCSVLQLLALTFLEKPDCECRVRPKDGDPTNISLDNAEWVPCGRITQEAWANGKFDNRKKKSKVCTKESIDLLRNTLQQFDEHVTMLYLSELLSVPYSTVRYSMYYLRDHDEVEYKHGKGWKLRCLDR